MTSRFNLGRDIKEISSEDIPFSRFSPPSSFRFFEERERGKGKGEVLRGHERFYVKLEEISVTRNFVCMMRDVFFFFFFFSLRDEYWRRRGFLDVKGVMGMMWDMRRGRMLAMRGI